LSGTDDLRESPSLKIIDRLIRGGVAIQAYDPTQVGSVHNSKHVKYAASALAACEGADLLAVFTEWEEFSSIDPKSVASKLRNLLVFDGRNILNKPLWVKAGFTYKGIGQ